MTSERSRQNQQVYDAVRERAENRIAREKLNKQLQDQNNLRTEKLRTNPETGPGGL